LWDVNSGAELATLGGHNGPVRNVSFSADGTRALTTSDFRSARIWRVFTTTEALIRYARSVVPRGLTRQQLDKAFLDAEPLDWFVEMEKWPYQGQAWRTGFWRNAPVRIESPSPKSNGGTCTQQLRPWTARRQHASPSHWAR
jgi:hypothetical protein